jgi:hypothetical protein
MIPRSRRITVKTYRVEVSPNSLGYGTCNAAACRKWGNIDVTFRDSAAFACSDEHVLTAAIELVRYFVRQTVKRFRVETYSVRYERVETILSTSDEITEPAR